MEKRRVVTKINQVLLYCDNCNEEMKFTGEQLLSAPVQNIHKCPRCGAKKAILGKMYPYFEYEYEGVE